jgi:hypothetical protein
MSYEFRKPMITAPTEQGQLLQIKSYLIQLAEQLNFALRTLEGSAGSGSGSDGAYSLKLTPGFFSEIKSLIIKSNDIVDAYYAKMEPKFGDKIEEHNTAGDSHTDIRGLITSLSEATKTLQAAVKDKASASDLTAHVGNKSNPHEVDCEQIGALPNTVKSMKNPYSLKVTGAASATYDGSQEVNLNIPTIAGPAGEIGYYIKATVDRQNFTEANWATYGEVGHQEYWSDTSSSGMRYGDLFIVAGTATDSGKGHMAIYRFDDHAANGTLSGVCIGHNIIAARGATGPTGATGSNGSNGVSCTHSWSGTTLTVTSASGTSSANLKGDTGATGATGPAGKTPVKGTDYYTAADKTEMVNMVLAALPTWTGGSY